MFTTGWARWDEEQTTVSTAASGLGLRAMVIEKDLALTAAEHGRSKSSQCPKVARFRSCGVAEQARILKTNEN